MIVYNSDSQEEIPIVQQLLRCWKKMGSYNCTINRMFVRMQHYLDVLYENNPIQS